MLADLSFALAQGAVFFGVMLTLFRFRRQIGLGTFIAALCALTFAENYLAITVFVGIGPLTYTPGSVVLFTGKLLLLLLVYIREDAETVRQPIYGLLIGNLVIVTVVVLVSFQTRVGTESAGTAIDVIADSTWLSVWGTFLLFVDCMAMILIYERLVRVAWIGLFSRIWLSVILVLTFDQLAFFTALYAFFGVPFSAGIGGFLGKVSAAGLYSAVLWAYLRWFEDHVDISWHPHRLWDVFDILTYRQRFEALSEAARLDPLTGALNRRALDDSGQSIIDECLRNSEPVSVFMIDIDGFKGINDTHGHAIGDDVLRQFVVALKETLRVSDPIYRYGGDEFVVIAPGADHAPAERMAGGIEEAASRLPVGNTGGQLSASIGIATATHGQTDLAELITAADRAMYAKRQGTRDRRRPSQNELAPDSGG
ncbi:GGDEF domain-containing protein [Amorphus orientalis]|uniref:diguanylate cyclase n=1 Tax=Amorphus orientalis TaxID=649198 RepID=A0AAE3VNQ7_9HYPH|nr:GGDEF domain-containing protein [Amorphus orientalis]MDQ0315999.1 diguanylate cyclase (GGDEF)-like protein [Amorphus orientalis]